jgi:hypothetical protein
MRSMQAAMRFSGAWRVNSEKNDVAL